MTTTAPPMEPKEAFNKYFHGVKNFMTPNVLGYSRLKIRNKYIFHLELSEGRGLHGNPLHAVTVLREVNGELTAMNNPWSDTLSESDSPISDHEAGKRMMDLIERLKKEFTS